MPGGAPGVFARDASGVKVGLIDAALWAAHVCSHVARFIWIQDEDFCPRIAAAFDAREARVIEIEKVALSAAYCSGGGWYGVCGIVAAIRQRTCNGFKARIWAHLIGQC